MTRSTRSLPRRPISSRNPLSASGHRKSSLGDQRPSGVLARPKCRSLMNTIIRGAVEVAGITNGAGGGTGAAPFRGWAVTPVTKSGTAAAITSEDRNGFRRRIGEITAVLLMVHRASDTDYRPG